MVCISPGPMPAVVSAAEPRRSPDVMKGERGSSGMVLRLRVMPARSSTSWASLPVRSASKVRRSTRTMWLSVPPETSRNPSAASAAPSAAALATTAAAYVRNSGRAASAKATALAAMMCSSGPPWRPGKTALSIFLARSDAAQDGAAPGAAQRLVRGEGHHVGHPDRARVGPAGDEAGRVRGVEHEQGAHRVGDLPERHRVDGAGVGGGAGHDEGGLLALGQVGHLVEVDDLARLAGVVPGRRHPVGDEAPHLGGDGGRRAVGQVPPVVEPHGQNGGARLQEGLVDGQIGVGTGVRLHVGVVGAEQRRWPGRGPGSRPRR